MSLQNLLSKKFIWRACDLTDLPRAESASGIPTGIADLDLLLYGRGWPRDALVEVFIDVHGCGELRLLMPALRHLIREEARWIAWVNPPFVPYAPALGSMEIDVHRVLLVYPNSHREALWAMEKIVESGSCSAVLAWLSEHELKAKQLRRIQTRAKATRVWVTIFRPMQAVVDPSPAELRIRLRNLRSDAGEKTTLSILKRKGGWAVSDLPLQLQGCPDDFSAERMAGHWNQWRQVER